MPAYPTMTTSMLRHVKRGLTLWSGWRLVGRQPPHCYSAILVVTISPHCCESLVQYCHMTQKPEMWTAKLS